MRRLTQRMEEAQAPAFGWHRPPEIQEMLTQAYLRAHSLKADFDRMEEIPEYLKASYSAVLKLTGAIGKAQDAAQEVYNQMRHARTKIG